MNYKKENHASILIATLSCDLQDLKYTHKATSFYFTTLPEGSTLAAGKASCQSNQELPSEKLNYLCLVTEYCFLIATVNQEDQEDCHVQARGYGKLLTGRQVCETAPNTVPTSLWV